MAAPRLQINPFVSIALSEIEFSFVRSSGPGGQNVNKVNSKAVLRFNLMMSPSFNEEMKARLLAKLESKLSQNEVIILTSDVSRDQNQNREICLEKLKALLIEALHIPKKRKASKPSYSSRVKAKTSNKKHSEKKKMRQKY